MSPRRHSDKTIRFARALAHDGLNASQIVKVFEREGIKVGHDAVRRWIDADYRERRNRQSKAVMRRTYARRPHRPDHALNRAKELKARGLSYEAISVVLDVYHGRQITGESVRHMFRHDMEVASAASSV